MQGTAWKNYSQTKTDTRNALRLASLTLDPKPLLSIETPDASQRKGVPKRVLQSNVFNKNQLIGLPRSPVYLPTTGP